MIINILSPPDLPEYYQQINWENNCYLKGAKPQLTQSSIVIKKTISDAQVTIMWHCGRNKLEESPMEWNYYLGMKPQFKVISTFKQMSQ